MSSSPWLPSSLRQREPRPAISGAPAATASGAACPTMRSNGRGCAGPRHRARPATTSGASPTSLGRARRGHAWRRRQRDAQRCVAHRPGGAAPHRPLGRLSFQTGLRRADRAHGRRLGFAAESTRLSDLHAGSHGSTIGCAQTQTLAQRRLDARNHGCRTPQHGQLSTAARHHCGQTGSTTLAGLPEPHVLQSWEWGEVKGTGRVACGTGGGASSGGCGRVPVLWRQPLPGAPLRVAYIPKGPVLDWANLDLVDDVLG